MQSGCPSAEDAEHRPEGKDPVHLLAEGKMNISSCYHNAKTNSEFIYSFPFQVFMSTVPIAPYCVL